MINYFLLNLGLMSDMDNANLGKLSTGIYGSTYNGHAAQNYYLTGDGNSDPSPNSNETGQTEFWNTMKPNMMHENSMPESDMNYNTGYNMMNNQLIDPNAYINSYSPYYQAPGYQQLDDETLVRKKMSMDFNDFFN